MPSQKDIAREWRKTEQDASRTIGNSKKSTRIRKAKKVVS
jgi:hypothetical protein